MGHPGLLDVLHMSQNQLNWIDRGFTGNEDHCSWARLQDTDQGARDLGVLTACSIRLAVG